MSVIPITSKQMTLEEYVEFDRNNEGRFEYFDGELFELSGSSIQHADIETNLLTILKRELTPKGCRVNSANVRLKVPRLPTFRYADLSALCGKRIIEKFSGVDILINPSLIVEILSESTASYDRGQKFYEYKSIESFREYLLVEQNKQLVTLYTKHNEKFWFQSEYETGETFKLESLDCELIVDEIYQGVEFDIE